MVCFTEQEELQSSAQLQPPELEGNTGVSEQQQLPVSTVKAEFKAFEESAKTVRLKLIVSPQESASPVMAKINLALQSVID